MTTESKAAQTWSNFIREQATSDVGRERLKKSAMDLRLVSHFGYPFHNLRFIPLRPVIFARDSVSRLDESVRRLLFLIENLITKEFDQNPASLLKRVGMPDHHLRYLTHNPAIRKFSGKMVRPDIIATRGHPLICEFNVSASLGGMIETSLMQEHWLSSPLGIQTSKRHALSANSPVVALKRYLEDVCFSAGFKPPYRCAISDLESDPQFKALAAVLSAKGLSTAYANVTSFKREEGQLRLNGAQVHAVIQNYLLRWLNEPSDWTGIQPLRDAANWNESMVLPDAWASVLSSKINFALLFQEIDTLSPRDQDLIRAYVPYTTFLTNDKLRLGDKNVARETALGVANKNDWVLKASGKDSGEDITIGASSTDAEWIKAVKNAMNDPESFIVQRFQKPDQINIPAYDKLEDKIDWFDVSYLMSPYYFGDHTAGMYMRFNFDSSNYVINYGVGSQMGVSMIEDSPE